MRILIVEDEEKLAQLMKDTLKKEGYAVDYLTDGQKAQRRIQLSHNEYDVIILDLMLPNKGGLEICKEIRQLNVSTPFLVLTANNTLESKVTLLNSGADDYLVKPFEFEELLSRIRAISRRPKQALHTELKVSGVALNTATQKVSVGGREVKFTLREFRILEYLMRNPNIVLSREEITSNIWDFNYDSFSNVVDVFINKIRGKVDKDNKLIETVRGIGYRLNA
ncbi:MAG: DNA-binding response regulator [Candidatus Staskawiczbacteria bacterium RIFCSPLOWO2_01_FULL_40_39]|uniref:DNA-binding response regulator n=1 Tax=Candidatus Staskawiczbacteria bacterium RIFCSPHIGHO2_01_FULL_39_25 TaxID=1802202 RepID=A0A1G2HQQ0_9BACT|nr:MAG: DNA-binding response regulator [Candidatus Staskawiczbacteria bacterium RIFCSPHIGHO2_01_FULL_39_25]OGZ72717.1 MAG: DNA-binding response regulator [Candidatus Staskawiczbacteria bacterium RIFCSPLOWO2_01_FULL_40_39]OGZ76600.1 MAG: DNA-binding response regulator [Candidatus Staskawiczbacteria bacterium RIFCSPLOWO2_02_FULL_39_8]